MQENPRVIEMLNSFDDELRELGINIVSSHHSGKELVDILSEWIKYPFVVSSTVDYQNIIIKRVYGTTGTSGAFGISGTSGLGTLGHPGIFTGNSINKTTHVKQNKSLLTKFRLRNDKNGMYTSRTELREREMEGDNRRLHSIRHFVSKIWSSLFHRCR